MSLFRFGAEVKRGVTHHKGVFTFAAKVQHHRDKVVKAAPNPMGKLERNNSMVLNDQPGQRL